MVIKLGRPFWTFVWTFSINMVALLGVDQIDVIAQPISVSDWWAATLLSLFVAFSVYAKIKVEEQKE